MNIDDILREFELVDTSGDPINGLLELQHKVVSNYRHLKLYHNPTTIVYELDLSQDKTPKYLTTWIRREEW